MGSPRNSEAPVGRGFTDNENRGGVAPSLPNPGPGVKALAYARGGWPVFPCGVDKKPLTPNGFKDATTDPEQIRAWWSQYPGASIGCPTGPGMGKSGAWVLDVDVPTQEKPVDGRESLAALEAKHGPLPPTVEQKTGGGGRQVFFYWPVGREIRNSAGKIGPGLDVRGAGGYVILPPSGHPSGGTYAWTGNGASLADAPEWLLDLVAPLPRPESSKPAKSTTPKSAGTTPYGRKALEEEAAKVTDAPNGSRNDALNKAAYAVGQLVAGGGLDRSEAETVLYDAAARSGLEEDRDCGPLGIRKTIASGFKAGEKEPRTAPESKKHKRRQASPGASSFVLKDSGVYCLAEDGEGNVREEWVCSRLAVLALARNQDGTDWGRLIEVVDADGQAKRWAMPMSMLKGSGDDLRGELLFLGLEIAPGGKARARLAEYLTTARPEARARCVNRVGWHGNAFVLTCCVFGAVEGEEIVLQGGPADHAFRVAGSLEDWQEAIGRLCPGNSRLVFAVSYALAAPLLCLAGIEPGGAHFVGASTTGKTTALRVAGSVWGGGGLNGYLKSWRSTDNALESTALTHCDALLCLDELSQVDPRSAAATAYMLFNGQGKGRANKEGNAKAVKGWRVLLLSTGEIGLADKIKEDGKGRMMAGQAVRMVDIPADAGAGFGIFEDLHGFETAAQFARHLNEQVQKFYGAPIRAFLEKLTSQHLEEAKEAAPAIVREFIGENCPPGTDGQVERVAARFGLAAAAGEFGIVLGVLPWEQGEARQAAARCFRDWLDARGGTGAAEVTASLAQVRRFFQAHGSSRFEAWGDNADAVRVVNRAGFRRLNGAGEWEYFVPPAMFKEEIARGHDAKRLVKALLDRSLILTGKDGSPATICRIAGQASARYYHFAATIVTGED